MTPDERYRNHDLLRWLRSLQDHRDTVQRVRWRHVGFRTRRDEARCSLVHSSLGSLGIIDQAKKLNIDTDSGLIRFIAYEIRILLFLLLLHSYEIILWFEKNAKVPIT